MISHVVRYVLSNMHLIMYENGDCYQNMNEKHRFSVMLKASIYDTLQASILIELNNCDGRVGRSDHFSLENLDLSEDMIIHSYRERRILYSIET